MNVDDNVFGYPQPVWQRFAAPIHAGELATAEALRAITRTPASSATLELSLQIGSPLRARFRAYGCPVTLAVGEWIAEVLERDGLDALDRLDAPAIRDALEIPEDRAHCALMGEDAVRVLRRHLHSRAA